MDTHAAIVRKPLDIGTFRSTAIETLFHEEAALAVDRTVREPDGNCAGWPASRGANQQADANDSLPMTLYHWRVGDELFYTSGSELGVTPADQFGYGSLLDEPPFAPIR